MLTDLIKGDSYKEEVAIAMVIYLMYLGVVNYVGVLEVLVWPFIVFIISAFGMKDALTTITEVKTRR